MKTPNKGWIPDVPSIRDWKYADTHYTAVRPRPRIIDLRPKMPPVEDQLYIGSCTANAAVGATEYLDVLDGGAFTNDSRLFVYYNSRLLSGLQNVDSGSYNRDTIRCLIKWGCCDESMWPYDPTKVFTQPDQTCYDAARPHKILSYSRLNTRSDMLNCLNSGFPFIFGFTCYESFDSEEVARTGIVNMPKLGEKDMGGHAVLAVGYDLNQRRFIVRNSWGVNWGMQGYFTMPEEYLTNRDLSDDFWTIRKQA